MKTIMTTVGAAAMLMSGAAIANAASVDTNAYAVPYATDYAGLYTGRSVSLGRYSKTPTGNFNSTRSLLDGTASGEGSGPGAGSPNGG